MRDCPYIGLISTFKASLASVTHRLDNGLVPECYIHEEELRKAKLLNDIKHFQKSKLERDDWYSNQIQEVA